MKLNHQIIFSILLYLSINNVWSHNGSNVNYLANEAIMVTNEQSKILIDPFFHKSFGTYTLVPETMRQAIFSNKAPYHNIDAIFISHAHDDHFDAKDVLTYLHQYPKVLLIAPKQAVDILKKLKNYSNIEKRIHSINLEKGDQPVSIQLKKLMVEAVRIPHAGWPARADVQNIVYRITSGKQLTVMHLGDADPNEQHYKPYASFFNQVETDIAFPPYWFFLSPAGQSILRYRLNAKKYIGVHVPKKVPVELIRSGNDYFSKPGEIRKIEISL